MKTKYLVHLENESGSRIDWEFANLYAALEFYYRKKAAYASGYVARMDNGFRIKNF